MLAKENYDIRLCFYRKHLSISYGDMVAQVLSFELLQRKAHTTADITCCEISSSAELVIHFSNQQQLKLPLTPVMGVSFCEPREIKGRNADA